MLRRAGLLGLAVSASPLILAACQQTGPTATSTPGATTPGAVRTGGQATMAIFGSTGASLLPNFTTTNFAITASQCLFDSLFRYDPDFNLVPWLAESVDVSADSRTYTFKLRQGAKWSDGEPFTARDVEAAVLAISDPATVTNWLSYVEEIEGAAARKRGERNDVPGIEVVDETTVRVTTVQPSAIFLDLFGTNFMPLPKHVLDTIPMDQLAQSSYTHEPTVSSGAFRLVRHAADQFIELERNPHFWGEAAKLDRAFVRIMTPETAIAALQRGEVDVIPGEISGELPANDAQDLKANPDITVTSYQNNNTETLYINLKTIFPDVRVRQAILYAIDRQAIVDTALLGFGKVADSVFPDFSQYYDESALQRYTYDPDRASQLLSEADWDSTPEVNFLLPTGDTTRDQVGTIIHQQLAAVGVNGVIERVDFATGVNRLIRSHTFDLALFQNRGFNNLDVSRRFACRMLDGGVNAGGYCSEGLDQIMEEARMTVGLEEQKPLVSEIQRIISEDVPTAMIYHRDSIGAVNTSRIGGAVPRRGGVQLDLNQWHLK
ncbi:MAG: ABC transporter substrate-binding protein [Candidatus Limnocylindria bacterium]